MATNHGTQTFTIGCTLVEERRDEIVISHGQAIATAATWEDGKTAVTFYPARKVTTVPRDAIDYRSGIGGLGDGPLVVSRAFAESAGWT